MWLRALRLENGADAAVICDDVSIKGVELVLPRGGRALYCFACFAVELTALVDPDDDVFAEVREVRGKLVGRTVAGVLPVHGIPCDVARADHVVVETGNRAVHADDPSAALLVELVLVLNEVGPVRIARRTCAPLEGQEATYLEY